MAGAARAAVNVVCVASYFKGADFLRECAELGARVELLTRAGAANEPWPREALAGFHPLPDHAGGELFVHAAAHLCRERRLHALVALEEFDVITAALAREHLRLPGLDSSRAHVFRDKLAMRAAARDAGIVAPEFVQLCNYQEVGEFMGRVPAPWVLKPRTDVSAIGIRKLTTRSRSGGTSTRSTRASARTSAPHSTSSNDSSPARSSTWTRSSAGARSSSPARAATAARR